LRLLRLKNLDPLLQVVFLLLQLLDLLDQMRNDFLLVISGPGAGILRSGGRNQQQSE
jgi:hypothetical protein